MSFASLSSTIGRSGVLVRSGRAAGTFFVSFIKSVDILEAVGYCYQGTVVVNERINKTLIT